jgi:3-hydroxyisobutyrate dehydrogenase-like beta-hydroxyacid dehydrogenase
MQTELGIIGFGEAGSSFAAAAGWGARARAFDIRSVDFAAVIGCVSLAEAVEHVPVIVSVVTAEASVDVARQAAPHLAPGTFYFDCNSVSPDAKRNAASVIEAAGGCYVDTAVMAPVNPRPMQVPLLLSGPRAAEGAAILADVGFASTRVVGEDVGRAATIKMLRSVMYKGVEALTAECLLACERAGVTEEVLASFGNDWSENADYRLDRMLVHGVRRAAEMAQSAETLRALGVSPQMTERTVFWQQAIGELQLVPPPAGLDAKLTELLRAMR